MLWWGVEQRETFREMTIITDTSEDKYVSSSAKWRSVRHV